MNKETVRALIDSEQKSVAIAEVAFTMTGVVLPKDVCHKHLFHYLSTNDLVRIANVSRGAYHMATSFSETPYWYRRKLLEERIFPKHLIYAAERAGIKIHYDTLYRLTHTAAHIFFDLHRMPTSAPWLLAAMSADIGWLDRHYPGKKWLQMTDASTDPIYPIDLMAFAGKHREFKRLKLTKADLSELQRANLMYFAVLGGDPITIAYCKKLIEYDVTKPIKRIIKSYPNILFVLSEGGDLDLIQYYLRTWPKHLKVDYTQLALTAAEHGHFEVYDYLASTYSVPLDAKTPMGKTIAHFAAQFGKVERLKKMNRKLITMEDPLHKTPLHYASEGGKYRVIMEFGKLEDMQANINTYKETHLHFAALKRQVELYAPLINICKIKPTAENIIHRSPIHNCAVSGDWNGLQVMLKHCDPSVAKNLPSNLLTMAIDYKQMYFADCLIAQYPAFLDDKAAVAHATMDSLNIFAVKHMQKKHGVDMCVLNEKGDTPLHTAVASIIKNCSHFAYFIQQVINELDVGLDLIDIPNRNGKTVRELMHEFNGSQYPQKNILTK